MCRCVADTLLFKRAFRLPGQVSTFSKTPTEFHFQKNFIYALQSWCETMRALFMCKVLLNLVTTGVFVIADAKRCRPALRLDWIG